MMASDPVVDEVRRIREELAARFNHDIESIGRHAQRLDAASGSPVVRREPRRPIQSMQPAAKTA